MYHVKCCNDVLCTIKSSYQNYCRCCTLRCFDVFFSVYEQSIVIGTGTAYVILGTTRTTKSRIVRDLEDDILQNTRNVRDVKFTRIL